MKPRIYVVNVFVVTLLQAMFITGVVPSMVLADTPGWEKIADNPFLKSVTATPYGLAVGETDRRTGIVTHSGVFISSPDGSYWIEAGLSKRGVTDVTYSDGVIYATTYYTVNGTNGLFASEDYGATWAHMGNVFSASRVKAENETVYLGTYNNGLWVSKDKGTTWVQKIGSGWIGPEIKNLSIAKYGTYAVTTTSVMVSKDTGGTWQEVSALKERGVRYIEQCGKDIIAGSSYYGLFLSEDGGDTWQTLGHVIGGEVKGITCYRDNIFIASYDSLDGTFTVFQSRDGMLSWKDTGLNIKDSGVGVGSSARLLAGEHFIYLPLIPYGLFRYRLEEPTYSEEPFLRPPWEYESEKELTDRITAFFDHQYPLLGYSYYKEPLEERGTTVNYLGMKAGIPSMYYSSHDGTDYRLPYGSPILAASEGYATYYYCRDCGHTIKIAHPNGYQTVYMHLQEEDLVTRTGPVEVTKGQVIGKVGMTGRTTGPHLHFSVLKDTDGDGSFEDETPRGKTDPYSWQNRDYVDPWASFNWTDTWGAHKGVISSYLWDLPQLNNFTYIDSSFVELVHSNKKIVFENDSNRLPVTAQIIDYVRPDTLLQKYLTYIPQTSFLVQLKDHWGKTVSLIGDPVQIMIDVSSFVAEWVLSGIEPEGVGLYLFDEELGKWNKLESFFNAENETITALTGHFSWFALMATQEEGTLISTTLRTDIQPQDGWFAAYPTVWLEVENCGQSCITFYSIGNDHSWQEYEGPFTPEQEGIYSVFYKSFSPDGNEEPLKESILKVDLGGLIKSTRTIKSAILST
jgi:murein DD-endopeptidase MepM/ murein hydrolase activator NlpD